MLEPGYYDLPPGTLAAVVTHLDMLAPVARRPEQAAGLTLRRCLTPDPDWYRAFFARVGGQDWLWSSRLEMTHDALCAIIHDKDVEVCVLRDGDNAELGLLELDFREADACELAFFGLAPQAIGAGAGRFLMNRAIERAWARPIRRFHVHTCTLDHPAALQFYMRSGFIPRRRQIEVMRDPRLSGVLPPDAGAGVPVLD